MNLIRFVLILGSLVMAGYSSVDAAVSQSVADSIQQILTQTTPACTTCPITNGPHTSRSIANIFFILAVLVLGSAGLYMTYKRKLVLVGGAVLIALVLASYWIPSLIRSSSALPEACSLEISKFKTPDAGAVAGTVDSGSSSLGDEFTPMGDETASVGSEFESVDEAPPLPPQSFQEKVRESLVRPMVYEPIAILILLGLISFLMRYPWFRKTRGVFLLGAIVYFGFYRGGCPCMISSVQDLFLWVMQKSVPWVTLIWIIALIFAAYVFGKVWCGWLCHLGALQEFLHRPLKSKLFSSEKAQRRLKLVQIGFFCALLVQLLITKTNLFCHYDPFKVAYNLTSANVTGYVLLAILLATSLFIERPFCRSICPAGLLFGLISRIPGARRLVKGPTCVNCVTCSHHCPSKAMLHEHKATTLHGQECLLCGECMASCKKGALSISRQNPPIKDPQ
jgi:ferredoxin